MIIPFPTNEMEAMKIIAMAEFDEDDIAEVGDNLVVIKNGNDFTITEPDAPGDPEVTYRMTFTRIL